MAFFYDKYLYDKIKDLETRINAIDGQVKNQQAKNVVLTKKDYSFDVSDEVVFTSKKEQSVTLKISVRLDWETNLNILVNFDGIEICNEYTCVSYFEKTLTLPCREGNVPINFYVNTSEELNISFTAEVFGVVDYPKENYFADVVNLDSCSAIIVKEDDSVYLYKYTDWGGREFVSSVDSVIVPGYCVVQGQFYLCVKDIVGSVILYTYDQDLNLIDEAVVGENFTSVSLAGGEYLRLFYVENKKLYRKSFLSAGEFTDSLKITGKKISAFNLGEEDGVFVTDLSDGCSLYLIGMTEI